MCVCVDVHVCIIVCLKRVECCEVIEEIFYTIIRLCACYIIAFLAVFSFMTLSRLRSLLLNGSL